MAKSISQADTFIGTLKDMSMGDVSYYDATLTGITVPILAASSGTTNLVKVAPTTTLVNHRDFDNGGANNGRLRYIGTQTKMFHVALSISFGGGALDTFVIWVAKNGTATGAPIFRKMGAGGDIGSSATHAIVSLAQNDYLEVHIGNLTNADDPTVVSLNLVAMGMQ